MMRDYSHFDRAFRTKHKSFTLRLDETGGRIKIFERNRSNNFVLEIDLGGGDWLSKVVGEALKEGRNGDFRRTFRGSNY